MEAAEVVTVLMIVGMRSNHCRELVTEALESVEGMNDVTVSLYRSQAVTRHATTVTATLLIAAVERNGYGASVVEA